MNSVKKSCKFLGREISRNKYLLKRCKMSTDLESIVDIS